jgi:outer membrane protein assembly factor BamB
MGLSSLSLLADPGDWPGLRGVDRSGVSTETGLLKEWPRGGPKLLWKATKIGGGYSAPSVSKGRIFLLGSQGGSEYLLALDVKDGKQVWSDKVGGIGKNNGPQYPGPRGTPTLDGDLVYALGSDGDLICAAAEDGMVKWRKNLRSDLDGRMGNWAYAESPLIDGDLLICTPGGSKATMAALNKKTGEVVWKASIAGSNSAAYSSPIIAEAGGVKQYVTFLSGNLVGVAARDGKPLWRYAKSANGTANIPTPVHYDGHVFSVSGYGTGGGVIQLAADGTTKDVWFSRELVSQIGGYVLLGDHLYGCSDKQLFCIEFKTGKVKWQNASVGKGAVCIADGMLYVRGQGGSVALAEASPAGYMEKGRFTQPDRSKNPAWPYPVVANGRLYLRDGDVLLCYDVKAQ